MVKVLRPSASRIAMASNNAVMSDCGSASFSPSIRMLTSAVPCAAPRAIPPPTPARPPRPRSRLSPEGSQHSGPLHQCGILHRQLDQESLTLDEGRPEQWPAAATVAVFALCAGVAVFTLRDCAAAGLSLLAAASAFALHVRAATASLPIAIVQLPFPLSRTPGRPLPFTIASTLGLSVVTRGTKAHRDLADKLRHPLGATNKRGDFGPSSNVPARTVGESIPISLKRKFQRPSLS